MCTFLFSPDLEGETCLPRLILLFCNLRTSSFILIKVTSSQHEPSSLDDLPLLFLSFLLAFPFSWHSQAWFSHAACWLLRTHMLSKVSNLVSSRFVNHTRQSRLPSGYINDIWSKAPADCLSLKGTMSIYWYLENDTGVVHHQNPSAAPGLWLSYLAMDRKANTKSAISGQSRRILPLQAELSMSVLITDMEVSSALQRKHSTTILSILPLSLFPIVRVWHLDPCFTVHSEATMFSPSSSRPPPRFTLRQSSSKSSISES